MNYAVGEKSVDQAGAIAPQIRRIIRDRIVKNDLPPGSRLSEAEIAKTYGISRQPVREAFIKLADEGLLLIRPQRSTLVTAIDYPTVLQSRFVREAVEADIVRIVATNPSPGLIRELRTQLKRQSLAAENDPTEFFQEDEKFHRTLAEAADKEVAWQFIQSLNGQMDRVRVLSFGLFPNEKLIEQHCRIIDQIEAGSGDGASREMRNHLNELIRTLPEIVRQNRRMFERVDNPSTTKPPSNREDP